MFVKVQQKQVEIRAGGIATLYVHAIQSFRKAIL